MIDLGRKQQVTKERITALTTEIANAEAPTKRQRAELARLSKDLTKTGTELSKARGEWTQHRQVLEQNGIATKRYADLQGQIASRQSQSAAALRTYAGDLLKARDAANATATRLAAGDEAFKRQAESTRNAREALDAYRQRAQAASEATEQLSQSGTTTAGVFQRLRGLLGPVLAFFSVRTLVGGLQSIVREGSNAEQELGQLNAVLASTGRTAEFSAQELQNLARELASSSRFMVGDITNAETRLLSYTNIAREEFPRAMQIVLDQSARLGISLEQSAELVGRALQEPVKAMQALGRQGFVLEEGQKTLLKQLEETGRTAEAQAVIMDMLAESYGGAAQAQQLGTIAGLWKTIRENFAEFKNDIAARGVLDYFKGQLQDLLRTITELRDNGTLALWAQRTADAIVSTAKAVAGLFRQLAPLGALLAGLAQAIAEHAKQVIFLGKVYAALKLAELAGQFSILTRATLANAAATTAAGNAAAGATGKFGAMGTLIGKLPQMLRIGVAVFGVDFAIQQFQKLAGAVEYYQGALQAQERFDRNQKMLQQEQLALGKQLQQLYADSAGTAIKGAEELRELTRGQAEDYKFTLEQARLFYAGVIRQARATGDAQAEATGLKHWHALGEALKQTEQRLIEFDSTAARQTAMFSTAEKAVEKFDELRWKGEEAKAAVAGIFDGVDWTRAEGIQNASKILEEVSGRGREAAAVVEGELIEALSKLSNETLEEVKKKAAEAFAAGNTEAKRMVELVNTASFAKLGVDINAIRTGFTDVGKTAVDAFAVAVREVDNLGLTATQKAAAIAQAFDNAFRQASTQSELQALKESLIDALNAGSIGFVEFQARIAEVDAKLEALKRTGTEVGTDIAKGARVGEDALTRIVDAAESAASSLEKAGTAAGDAGDSTAGAAGDVGKMSFALRQMSDEAARALQGLNWLAGTQSWLPAWNRTIRAINDQYDQVTRLNEELERNAKAYDPIERELERLRDQFRMVDETTLRGLAQKKMQVEQEVARRRDEARRLREEADRAAEETRRAAAQEGLAQPVTDTLKVEFVAPDKAMATALRAGEQEVMDRLVNAAAPRIIQMIERSRSLSNARSAVRRGGR
ncbi:phage tail length tape measure family protein [Luteimonas aestuarii]|uniref:phage tail length tape measure family protein n=1 Tax=Luteimonas aestuarii TaxID=453837 RepID=UPI0014049FDF|nr:phage tail length tape measure family protein [Luteimonas aestuarii]